MTHVTRSRVAWFSAIWPIGVAGHLLASCQKCPDGTQRELVSYQASQATLFPTLVPKSRTTARCFTGTEWVEFPRNRNGINFIYKDSPTGATDVVKPMDMGSLKYKFWRTACEEGGVGYYHVALDELPSAGRFLRGVELRPGYTYAGTAKSGYGICLVNDYDDSPIHVILQYFVPNHSCVASPPARPPWQGGDPAPQCPKPEVPPEKLPDGPATSQAAKTCSGADAAASAQNFLVLAEAGTGCADGVTLFANSEDEAKGCVTSAGLASVGKVCDFEVLLETGPNHYVYPRSSSAENAIKCAKVIGGCDGCTPTVTSTGACYPP